VLHGCGYPRFRNPTFRDLRCRPAAARHRLSATVNGSNNFAGYPRPACAPAHSPALVRHKRDLTTLPHFSKVVFMIFESFLGLFGLVMMSLMLSIAIRDFSDKDNNNDDK
jgi:hypothetical protein